MDRLELGYIFHHPVATNVDIHEMFGQVTEIYLEDLIEIKKMPPEGFLSRYEFRTPGEEVGSISTTLPGVGEEQCSLYSLIPPEGHEPEKPARLQPLITF